MKIKFHTTQLLPSNMKICLVLKISHTFDISFYMYKCKMIQQHQNKRWISQGINSHGEGMAMIMTHLKCCEYLQIKNKRDACKPYGFKRSVTNDLDLPWLRKITMSLFSSSIWPDKSEICPRQISMFDT